MKQRRWVHEDISLMSFLESWHSCGLQATVREELKTKLPKLLKGVNEYLRDKPYLTGDKPCFADIALLVLADMPPTAISLKDYAPNFQRVADNLRAHPGVSAYLKKRAELEAAPATA